MPQGEGTATPVVEEDLMDCTGWGCRAIRRCCWCDQEKPGLYWGGDWLCDQCIDESTIEGIVVGDRIVPRFSRECQKLIEDSAPPGDRVIL